MHPVGGLSITLLDPGSTKLGPILFAHAVRAWANVVVTQGIAQGVSNIGPSLGRVRKKYWAKIFHNFATRAMIVHGRLRRSLYFFSTQAQRTSSVKYAEFVIVKSD